MRQAALGGPAHVFDRNEYAQWKARTGGKSDGTYERKRPPWLNNQLGKDHSVPKPWTPIAVRDDCGLSFMGFRRFCQRTWRLFEAQGKTPHILPHMTLCFEIPALSFCDSMVNGEARMFGLGAKHDTMDAWRPDELRIMGNAPKWGIATFWKPTVDAQQLFGAPTAVTWRDADTSLEAPAEVITSAAEVHRAEAALGGSDVSLEDDDAQDDEDLEDMLDGVAPGEKERERLRMRAEGKTVTLVVRKRDYRLLQVTKAP